jgi:glycosyltransferase involved in cell wall biosynthesis
VHPVAPALASAASKHRADLYIGHLVASLPAVALAASHHGSRYAFDAEDFHIGDFPPGERFELERRLTRLIEARYLPGAAFVTAAAPMIAEAYAKEYGIPLPTAVLNVFPLSHAPTEATPRGVTAPGPSIYWISQTIGPRRGLECAVRAIALAKAKPHLYLRGNPAPGFVDELQRIAGEAGASGRVHVLPLAPPSEMERIAAAFDIGLAGEVGDTLSRRLALPNKQFTYLLAGVPIVMSDTPAHSAFAAGLESCVRLFRIDDPRSLALAMDELLGSVETLAVARRRAFELGQVRFNWEVEQRVFLDAVARVLGEGRSPDH